MPISAQSLKKLKRAAAGVAAISVLAVFWDSTVIGPKLEEASLDFRYAHFNGDRRASDRVIVVDIDDQSLSLLKDHYGRWPWKRRAYKDLIEALNTGEPAGIFFDMLFSEPSPDPIDDEQLAEISEVSKNVSHAVQLLPDSAIEEKEHLPQAFVAKHALAWSGPAPRYVPLEYKSFTLPMSTILAKTQLTHLVSVKQDDDGVFRRLPLASRFDEAWFPSLTLKALAATLGDASTSMSDQGVVLTGLDRFAPADEKKQVTYVAPLSSDGFYRLHYYSEGREPKSYSASEVFQSASMVQAGKEPLPGKFTPLSVAGKIILIGTSATGLHDLKVTPISPHYSGVLLHATAISNILNGDFLRVPPSWASSLLVLFTLIIVYGFSFLTPHPLLRFAVPTAWLGAVTAADLLLFKYGSFGMELARPVGLGLLAFGDSLAYLIFVESRDKKKLKDSLSKYLPPTMAEQIIASGKDPRAEVGRQTELSILFSDLRGFTTLSELMEAKRLVEILNEYLGKMTDLVFEKGGTLDKFIGDAVMAFWGAPVEDPNHARHAIQCAMRMREELLLLNKGWEAKGLQPLQMGIGINTGAVIVGNIGSEKRLDYTVIGDNVNLASRLESLTKQYRISILVGHRTWESSREDFVYRPVDIVRVKGKKQFVYIYEPLVESTHVQASHYRGLSAQFESALKEYQTGNFERALKAFDELATTWTQGQGRDGLSEVFIERCRELIAEPPTEWDGTFVAKSK